MKKILTILALFIAFQASAQLYTEDTLANNAVFNQRVKSATVNAANQIAADTTQPDYVYKYANTIIASPNAGWLPGMTYQVVSNPAINYNSSDGDIQFTVNSNFEKCARAFSNVVQVTEDVADVRRYLNRKMNINDRNN